MKVISKARQLRLSYQAKLGRSVQIKDVAEATGITQAALSRIERGQTGRIDFDTLARLCAFYGVDVGEVLEYSPEILMPDLVAA